MVFLGFSVIAKTGFQKSPAIVRGSHFTNIQVGSSSSQCFNSGCVESYSPPVGKKARIKGTLSVTAFGAQIRIVLNQFDNVTGFNIVIAALSNFTNGGQTAGTVNFETEINSDQDFNVRGNSGGSGATGDCVMAIEELPT